VLVVARGERLVGIDVGLTACKAVATGLDGSEDRVVVRSTPHVRPGAGRIEVDMEALWGTVREVLGELTAGLAEHGARVVAVGVTGHGNGLYCLDRELRPAGPVIGSTDLRSTVLPPLPGEDVEWLAARTGSRPWAAQTPVLWRWLERYEPERARATRWIAFAKDWIRLRLTGALATDVTDLSAAGMADFEARACTAEVLARHGLGPELLDRLPESLAADGPAGSVTEEAARETGLPRGIPVGVGGYDCFAALVGADALAEGSMAMIAGTWGINVLLAPGDPRPELSFSQLTPDPGATLYMQASPASAPNLDWFTGLLHEDRDEAAAAALVEAACDEPPGADGITFLPYVNGSTDDPNAAGTFLGLRPHHGRVQLVRAVLEGVAHEHRIQTARLRSSGLAVEHCHLVGGGVRSRAVAQLFADVLELPVELPASSQAVARGAALLGGTAAGLFPDWRSAARAAIEARLEPDERTLRAHRAAARRFEGALEALRPYWSSAASP
jgi:L-xylulokinase